ncbi:hypothetical protein D9M71_438990 [compost metagenome]
MIGQTQPPVVSLDGAAGDGQAQAVAGAALVGGAEERFAQLRQILFAGPRAVVADVDFHLLASVAGFDFQRLAGRVEAQGIAQQVVEGAFEHVRPAFHAKPLGDLQLDVLIGRQ